MTDRRNFLISAALLSASACSGPIRATRQRKPGLNTAIPPDELNLNAMMQPVQATSVLQDPDWFIWGGGMVRTADGVCHGFFARWPRKAGFNAWVTHSEIIRATSPDPLGPWTMIGPVFDRRAGFWDADNLHNPLIQEFDGKYYLYYSGNYGPRDGTKEGWWIHRNNQRAGVAVANHPAGPWQRFDKPLIEPTPGGTDHLLTNSPTVARRKDGRYVLIYKGVSDGPMPFGGKVRMHVAIGDSPTGPFVKQPGTVFGHETMPFPTDDNVIWGQSGRLYAIVKDYRGLYSQQARPGSTEKESLVLFTSDDGLDWRLAAHPFVSDFHIRWADERVSERLHRLDQPQVWLENGKPSVLFLAVKAKSDDDNSDLSYNIQLKLNA
ncbi:MAG: glycoside hydrolase family protein [Rudanella sp.]|nr:glycoside hydrolase family protein [Rudanella sp.]